MKKLTITIVVLAATLASCSISENTAKSEAEVSWHAFCDKHAISYDCDNDSIYNRFLDCWCGSDEEDEALAAAGIIK